MSKAEMPRLIGDFRWIIKVSTSKKMQWSYEKIQNGTMFPRIYMEGIMILLVAAGISESESSFEINFILYTSSIQAIRLANYSSWRLE